MEQVSSVDDFFSGDYFFSSPYPDAWFEFLDLIYDDTKGDLIEP